MSHTSKKKQVSTKPVKPSKACSDSQLSRRTFKGLIPELPVLYPPSAKEYDEFQHNVHEVLERLTTHLTSRYGQAGAFLTSGKYYEEEEPTAPGTAYDATN